MTGMVRDTEECVSEGPWGGGGYLKPLFLGCTGQKTDMWGYDLGTVETGDGSNCRHFFRQAPLIPAMHLPVEVDLI